MGSMSASDAAPLPRLGEVFFDVRGDSRSMRLSWYADTGVAVFSIWQGGTCTGTFRLPMDDLDRMIEALRRGPQGQRAGRREAPGEAGPEVPPGRAANGAAPAGRNPEEGQATVVMRMPAGSGAPPGQRPRAARSRGTRPGRPATTARARTRPTRASSGGYPVDPLDPAYPAPAARYQEEPSTGAYRSPAQEYETGTGYPAEPGYQEGPASGDYRRGGAAGYPDVPATGDYRSAQSGSHRREAGDFPGEPRRSRYPGDPAAGEYRDEDEHGRLRRSRATRTCPAPVTTARLRPAATAAPRADTRMTPLSVPIPASGALRIIPAKCPPTTRGLIPPGRIMARTPSGMTRPTTPSTTTTASPRNPSPMGARLAITTAGNGDAIPAVIDG